MCTVEKINWQLVLFVKEHRYSEIKLKINIEIKCVQLKRLTGNFSFVC